jgi:DNA polymerase-3 subunit epsilon
VTGHTWEMLKDEPKFAEIADQFLDFVQDSELVAHNAGFDMGFINMELKRCGKAPIDPVALH